MIMTSLQVRIENEVAALGDLSREELAARWVKAYGCPPPKGVKRGLLERAAAWHLQARYLGGLSPTARKTIRDAVKLGSGPARRSASSPTRDAGRLMRAFRPPTLLGAGTGRSFRRRPFGQARGWFANGTGRPMSSMSAERRLCLGRRTCIARSRPSPGRSPARTGRTEVLRPMSASARLRCAIYTRKSSEEGLEQEFNSLDAQREACEAYHQVAGRPGLEAGAGPLRRWRLLGRHHGAPCPAAAARTTSRPAGSTWSSSTRSTGSPARSPTSPRSSRSSIAHGVSFVSVTQQFNTTTSMGRLTLNVLLSFAQFEREVTAERIRDKIAASKKKGMWMGGIVPLGYEVENRKLVVNPEEAKTVRWLFERYLELKSVRALVDDAASHGHSGRTATRRDGTTVTTRPFGRGNLYHLLSNVIYVGSIRHRDKTYDGEHQPIIDREMFDEVQRLLKDQTPNRRSSTNQADSHLLTGILYDEAGEKLRAIHANRKGVRYRYYVSRKLVEGRKKDADGWRLSANDVDSVVEHRVTQILHDRAQLTDWI